LPRKSERANPLHNLPSPYPSKERLNNNVIIFTGQSDKTTQPFYISGAKWRITWTANAESPEFGVFGFFVYPEGETAMYVESVSHDGSGSDITYIYQGNNSFYIKVLAANLQSWTIEVEDCISAVPPPQPASPEPKEEEGGCFIATAAYGTDTAREIDILRGFRDEILLPNSIGAQFVFLYYKTSPPTADFISQHAVLRTIVREGFVDPIVGILKWSHNLWSD
jgi:hypothetical protein